MKKISYISIILFAIILASCNNDLNLKPISSATSLAFYQTQNDFLQGVNAVYNSLRAYPDRQLNLSETRSDNIYAVLNSGVRNIAPINNFSNTLAGSNYITEAWDADFNGIFKANTLLYQLKENGDVISDADLKTRFEAEVRFLRAFYYFDLVRWFGKVPIADHPLSATESLSIKRNPVDEVYDFIIADLKFAVSNLPESYTSDIGRATKYAAEGILAEVYMARSGPTYGIEGPGLGLDEWSDALTLLDDIIQNTQYGFLSSYKNIFSYSNEGNPEVIFDVQYVPEADPSTGATFPWTLVPDDYFESIGEHAQGGLSIRPVSNSLLSSYEPNDNRKAFSIHLTGYDFNGAEETQSFFKKYLDTTQVPSNPSDWSVNFIVLRYTDVLMRKAECILHGASGTQSEIDAIVNQVRQRAGLDPVSHVTLAELMEERRREFAGEGIRWHDLVRSGMVDAVMKSWIVADDVQHKINAFQNNYIIYPIPQAELDTKPGLYTQNQGY